MKKGSRHTEETKFKISKKKIGVKFTDEHKAKISAAQRSLGKKNSPEIRLLMAKNSSSFHKCSINGKEYDSLSDASRDLKIPYRSLCSVVLYHPEKRELYGITVDWVEKK